MLVNGAQTISLPDSARKLKAFAAGIRFRLWQPHHPFPFAKYLSVALQALQRFGLPLERMNLRLPELDPLVRSVLGRVSRTPRKSSLANGAIIAQAVRHMPDEAAYVNIGVWHGYTYLAGAATNPDKRCIAVDSYCLAENYGQHKSLRQRVKFARLRATSSWARTSFGKRFGAIRTRRQEFHDMDYVDFLRSVDTGPIGVYLYDAIHEYEDQRQALVMAEPRLIKGAYIIVDDTNEAKGAKERRATLDFARESDHTYEVIVDRQTAINGHPTFWNGIMVLVKLD